MHPLTFLIGDVNFRPMPRFEEKNKPEYQDVDVVGKATLRLLSLDWVMDKQVVLDGILNGFWIGLNIVKFKNEKNPNERSFF